MYGWDQRRLTIAIVQKVVSIIFIPNLPITLQSLSQLQMYDEYLLPNLPTALQSLLKSYFLHFFIILVISNLIL